jgi:argininosuccinate lyase
MLHSVGLLAADELQAIRDGLRELGEQHARGEWRVTLALEDGQTALETLLTQRIGAAGARLHAGRSRNDQVLAALRLYLRDVVDELGDGADAAADALDALAAVQGRDRVAGLHAHAARNAVNGPAVGGRLRQRAA